MNEVEREVQQLKDVLKPFVNAGHFWCGSGADDEREVRITVQIGWLRDAQTLLGDG